MSEITDIKHVTDITTSEDLHQFVRDQFGFHVPRLAVCTGHQAPWEYVRASFFEDGDLIVWSCRGGGKSLCAALATTLRALARPGLEQVVLGGSQQQSDRVAEHIRGLLARMPDQVDRKSRRRSIRLANGSVIQVLAQSQTAVRGIHADRIRCDEVDLFDPDVWRAISFCTVGAGGGRGALEALSTAHVPGGLMEDLVGRAQRGELLGRLVKWCLWEVIRPCPVERPCATCPLQTDCGGKARHTEGFFPLEDALAIQARSSRAAWESEMLCRGARRDRLVYPEFDPDIHVGEVEYVPDWTTYRAIDFGYTDPFACLWIQLSPDGMVWVVDEYLQAGWTIDKHGVEIKRRDALIAGTAQADAVMRVAATFVDPAGKATSAAVGRGLTDILAAAGIPCTARASGIDEGLELIRAALAPAVGPPRLLVDRRCRQLIEAFRTYHYPDSATRDSDKPVKDGPDHVLDALRYFFVNRMRPRQRVGRGRY